MKNNILDGQGKKNLARRRHDLEGALRVLQMAVENIKDGYRFEDANAAAKIAAMEKAVKVVGEEMLVLLEMFSEQMR